MKSIMFSFLIVVFCWLTLFSPTTTLHSQSTPADIEAIEIPLINEIHIAEGILTAALNPDGTLIAVSEGTQYPFDIVSIWGVESGQQIIDFQGDIFQVTSLHWNPDGRRLAAAGNWVVVWDVETGQNLNILPFPFPNNQSNSANVEWSPDGTQLAYARFNYDPHRPFESIVQVWDQDTNTVTNVGNSLTSNPRTVRWSPDGSMLAIADADVISIWDADSGESILEISDLSRVTALAWNPNSNQLAYDNVVLEGTTFTPVIQIIDVSTEQIATLVTGEEINGVDHIIWSPDGSMLVTDAFDSTSRQTRILIWEVSTSEVIMTIEESTAPHDLVAIDWSLDGTRLVTASTNRRLGRDATIRIWDVSALLSDSS